MLFLKKKYRSIIFSCIIVGIGLSTAVYVVSIVQLFIIRSISHEKVNYENRHQMSFPRILCLIITSPKNLLTKAKAVNETWAPRCDRYFFITELPTNDISAEFNISRQLPIAPIYNLTPGYDHLTKKSVLGFLFACKNYIYDFDWFVKADDDTYLFIENLKKFLKRHKPSDPVTFGYNFKIIVTKGFHSGGASYVLSQEALHRFYQGQHDPRSNCTQDGGGEDIEIAKCLRTRGVYPGNSLDAQNRELFHPLPFAPHFEGNFPDWLQKHAENPLLSRYNCCSDETISFHYINASDQYLIDFLSYRMRTPFR